MEVRPDTFDRTGIDVEFPENVGLNGECPRYFWNFPSDIGNVGLGRYMRSESFERARQGRSIFKIDYQPDGLRLRAQISRGRGLFRGLCHAFRNTLVFFLRPQPLERDMQFMGFLVGRS